MTTDGDDSPGHYHCCYCSATYVRKDRFKKHLKTHADLSEHEASERSEDQRPMTPVTSPVSESLEIPLQNHATDTNTVAIT